MSCSSARIPFLQKVSELTALFRMRLRGICTPDTLSIFSDFEEYNELLLRYSNMTLEGARVVEIGFGARPYRLMALINLGVDARGIDLDVPALRGTLSEFYRMYKRNGTERVLKSVVRFFLFDLIERRYLAKELRNRGRELVIREDRFLIGDAANLNVPSRSLDLLLSEDVFEHIPLSSLEVLVPKMSRWLKPDGLAVIRPNIFTGITGGHLAEWFPHTLKDKSRKSEPWEHLRKKRWQANTYLNQLTRADYRDLFSSSFHILEEKVGEPDLGREFLTPSVASELTSYGEDELFSNRVLFVLKPRERALEI